MIEDFLEFSKKVDLSLIFIDVLNLTSREKNQLKKAGYFNFDDVACKIRFMPHTYSGSCRTLIPEHVAQ